ncbi:DUF4214 domain-containing protein, partial [Pseudomonas helleri]|uniref:DUF4214 domain-containing protein n=3 Tax=Pseudomonas helleri TaxID=1608996 RepID=UPI003FD31810
YAALTVNAIGQTTSRALFESELSLWWKGVFTDYSSYGAGYPNGYVEPTTQDLQRLYDASVGANGDPATIQNFSIYALDLVLETATDARWQPYYNLAKWSADTSHGAYEIGRLASLNKANAGIPQSNYIRDDFKAHPLTPYVDTPPLTPITTTLQVDNVTKAINDLYIGYFNRAPEHGGLKLWSGVMDSLIAGGKSFNDALIDVANQFWPAASVVFSHLTGYTQGMSTTDFVTKVYANVLGRPDAATTDLAGIQNWANALDNGTIKSRGEFIVSLENGAHQYIKANPTDPVSIHVDAFLSNRADVGLFFAQSQYSGGLSSDSAVTVGMAALTLVTDQASSVTTAINSIKATAHPALTDGVATIELTGAPVQPHDVFLTA